MRKILLIMLSFLFFSGCSSISGYDQHAYERATSLKAESLNMMNKAINPYSEHEEEAEKLKLEIVKIYEYTKGLDKNNIVVKQWEIIKNPNANSIAGFLKRWKTESKLNPTFIEHARDDIVAKGFDKVIALEGAKRKPFNYE